MSFFLLILLVVILFVLWPLIKVAYYYHRLKKKYTRTYQQSYSKPSQQNIKKKIFNTTDGEYVNFEEISDSSSQYSETIKDENSARNVSEEQISDTSWEDI